jgi:hypothetical protein
VSPERAESLVEEAIDQMTRDMEQKLAWLRSYGADIQSVVDEITVSEVMES